MQRIVVTVLEHLKEHGVRITGLAEYRRAGVLRARPAADAEIAERRRQGRRRPRSRRF
jgi:hypothetical protein